MKGIKRFIEEENLTKKVKYSIRKLSIGVTSIVVACSVMIGAMTLSFGVVKAEGTSIEENVVEASQVHKDLIKKEIDWLLNETNGISKANLIRRVLSAVSEKVTEKEVINEIEERQIDFKEQAVLRAKAQIKNSTLLKDNKTVEAQMKALIDILTTANNFTIEEANGAAKTVLSVVDEEKPADEEKPVEEEKPAVEPKPVDEEKPVDDKKPVDEVTPITDEMYAKLKDAVEKN